MYLEDIARSIRAKIPAGRLPDGDSDELFRLYAVLVRSKGKEVTQSDVHDVWTAWMAKRDGSHEALVPYADLPKSVQDEDCIFTSAIRAVAGEMGLTQTSRPVFFEILFPAGVPTRTESSQQMFELYKIMVQSSEGLVSRRQGVNTFFLTMNGALLTASGLIVQSAGVIKLGAIGIAVLSLAGVILCAAWRSLITSFGQLNRGKFQVINSIEPHLAVSIYAAEWEALGRGENPKTYRSFTSREIWVPIALMWLHILTALGAILVAAGVVSIAGKIELLV